MKVALATALIFVCQMAMAQNYSIDPYGHKINPARLPNEVENRTVRIGEMEIGERVQTFPEAMVVDDAGNCWLNPRYIAFPLKTKGDLEIIRNKLGYIVRINYKYHQTERGYSVPRWSKWERGYVPAGYIPIKSLVIDKPNYGKLSPSQELTRRLQQPYNPRFTAPEVPINPYSMEKQNVRSRPSSRSVRPSGSPASPGTGDFILPELFD